MKACVFVCVAEAWLPREVQEMQENLSRQDRQLEDLRRGIEEERKRRPVERHITPEEEGEELTSELARWTAVRDPSACSPILTFSTAPFPFEFKRTL